LSSTVTAASARSRVSVRDAARSWRESPVAPSAHADAHECAVEVTYRGQRLLARWSATKPAALSIDRRLPSRSMSDADAMRVRLHGTLALAGAKTSTAHFGDEVIVRIDADDALARECIARLFDPAAQRGEASTLFADALLRTLALHVHARYAAPVAASDSRGRLAPSLVQHLRTYIDARLERRLSRAGLARLAGCDPRAFSIAFRRTLGMTPMQYVIERRLDRACLLIASTARDLADIAISTGFSSQSHLTSTLKKRRGITPLRLRREAASASAAAAHG
jgi:AraC family transcriptional regulator